MIVAPRRPRPPTTPRARRRREPGYDCATLRTRPPLGLRGICKSNAPSAGVNVTEEEGRGSRVTPSRPPFESRRQQEVYLGALVDGTTAGRRAV